MRIWIPARFLFCLSAFLLSAPPAISNELLTPYADLVDDPFPTSVPIVSIGPESFRWVGAESLPAGTRIDFITGSAQWSRIRERIVLPRARIRIEIPGVEGAQIEVQSRLIPLRRSLSGSFVGEAVVPLISGTPSRILVRVRKNGVDSESAVNLERIPIRTDEFGIDPSCSPWGLELSARENPKKEKNGGVIIADCRMIRGESAEGMVAVLDVLLFVDGSGDSIRVNGVHSKAEAPSLFRLRLSSQAQPFVLETASGESYSLGTKIPPRLNRGFFGMGIGPYHYKLSAPDTEVDTTAGILTLYGSYQIGETVRLTAFNATSLHRNFFSDTGLYVKTNSVRIFDQRISGYLMLGANVVGYKYRGSTHFNFGAPQGFEATYHDFLSLNRTLTAGGFIYPPIDGKSYYNAWLRYGSPGFFLEMNYLSIRTQFESDSVSTRSVGVSIGFPIARFF